MIFLSLLVWKRAEVAKTVDATDLKSVPRLWGAGSIPVLGKFLFFRLHVFFFICLCFSKNFSLHYHRKFLYILWFCFFVSVFFSCDSLFTKLLTLIPMRNSFLFIRKSSMLLTSYKKRKRWSITVRSGIERMLALISLLQKDIKEWGLLSEHFIRLQKKKQVFLLGWVSLVNGSL